MEWHKVSHMALRTVFGIRKGFGMRMTVSDIHMHKAFDIRTETGMSKFVGFGKNM